MLHSLVETLFLWRKYMKIKSLLIIIIWPVLHLSSCFGPESGNTEYGTFSFEHKVTLPGSPEAIYDAITGDISGWWDHSFSEKPYKFYIETKPGGGFYELFNDSGDGVLHATVIAAQRGKLLRFDGPLGLAGQAIQIVTTYSFAPVETDSTQLTVSVRGAGELQPAIANIVSNVWHHFIFDRFKPYIENMKNK